MDIAFSIPCKMCYVAEYTQEYSYNNQNQFISFNVSTMYPIIFMFLANFARHDAPIDFKPYNLQMIN